MIVYSSIRWYNGLHVGLSSLSRVPLKLICHHCSIVANVGKHVLNKAEFEGELSVNHAFEDNSTIVPVTDPNHSIDLNSYAPNLKPTFNFAAYVNKSSTLQSLIKMGVCLYKLEKIKGVPEFLLKLDFEKHMKEHISFLYKVGVHGDSLGTFITKNPFIFKENLEDLQVRINYLESKAFSQENISEIISRNPNWLTFSVKKIDERLGYFQKTFSLSGNEVRSLAVKFPKLITYSLDDIKLKSFVIHEEMGFTEKEMKCLLLKVPKLWISGQKKLLATFNFVHNEMKISHEKIVLEPSVLLCREFRIKQRHLFLQKLKKDQYNETLPCFVSLTALVQSTDVDFCRDVAKTSVETFNNFLKTL